MIIFYNCDTPSKNRHLFKNLAICKLNLSPEDVFIAKSDVICWNFQVEFKNPIGFIGAI